MIVCWINQGGHQTEGARMPRSRHNAWECLKVTRSKCWGRGMAPTVSSPTSALRVRQPFPWRPPTWAMLTINPSTEQLCSVLAGGLARPKPSCGQCYVLSGGSGKDPPLQLLRVVGWMRLRAAPGLSSSFRGRGQARRLSRPHRAPCIPHHGAPAISKMYEQHGVRSFSYFEGLFRAPAAFSFPLICLLSPGRQNPVGLFKGSCD